MRLYAIFLGVFFVLILFAAFGSCDTTYTEISVEKPVDTGHKRIFSEGDLAVEKVTIEGHEYLLFYGRLATAPSAVHNENCPCKLKKDENYE